jgi:hypothetical protein
MRHVHGRGQLLSPLVWIVAVLIAIEWLLPRLLELATGSLP